MLLFWAQQVVRQGGNLTKAYDDEHCYLVEKNIYYARKGDFFFFLKFQKHYLKMELCGNPLQYSCLENPRDRGAWWAAVFGVAQSRTRLKRLSSSSSSMYKLGTQPGIWQVLVIIIVLIEGLSLY